MLANEIIQQLNEGHWSNQIIPFEIYYPIDARMSVYRDQRHWAIVIEQFVFSDSNFGHPCISTMCSCFGDDLPQAPGAFYPELQVTGDGPGGPLFDPDELWTVSPSAVDMTIRGKVVPITADPLKYAEAGIDLKNPPRVEVYELLRLIAPRHRRLFFATEAEIVERIGEEMPLLVRLSEWRDYDRLKTPADSETFPMIADAIFHDDPSLYNPTLPPNTHWSNWPDAPVV